MKRIFIIALAILAFAGCSDDNGGDDSQIVMPDDSEKTQEAFADDTNTGGFTFTARQAWTANVTEYRATRLNLPGGVPTTDNPGWLRLLLNGEETYAGAAGEFTLAIELDENYTGYDRMAAIIIVSGGDKITIAVRQNGKTATGEVPVARMRYVASVTREGDLPRLFEYDSQNRVVGISGGEDRSDVLYGDREVTIIFYDEDGEAYPHVFELNADGAIVSGNSDGDIGTATYKNGYLDVFSYMNDEVFTMEWSNGDLTGWVHEAEGFAPVPYRLTYDTSWPDNPLCNIDLNSLIVMFDDGIYEGLPETLGLFGNRSRHMISSWTQVRDNEHGESAVEYDSRGFVTKITVNKEDVYTVTYR